MSATVDREQLAALRVLRTAFDAVEVLAVVEAQPAQVEPEPAEQRALFQELPPAS